MRSKYPRIPHLPYSPGGSRDDRRLSSVESFLHRELVLTEKADGSNICLERTAVYARSHQQAPRHPSFDALKARHAALQWQIPEGYQVFGEWLWAVHSIAYDRLPDHLLIFGIRDLPAGQWLSWDATTAACQSWGVQTVPLLWRGQVETAEALQHQVEALTSCRTLGNEQEGVVVRLSAAFPDDLFAESVAKWVRPDHVQTDDHWSQQAIRLNQLVPKP